MGGCHFCTRCHLCLTTLLHEGPFITRWHFCTRKLFHKADTFARLLLCMQGLFSTRGHFCTGSLLHKETFLHKGTLLHGIIFLWKYLCIAKILNNSLIAVGKPPSPVHFHWTVEIDTKFAKLKNWAHCLRDKAWR